MNKYVIIILLFFLKNTSFAELSCVNSKKVKIQSSTWHVTEGTFKGEHYKEIFINNCLQARVLERYTPIVNSFIAQDGNSECNFNIRLDGHSFLAQYKTIFNDFSSIDHSSFFLFDPNKLSDQKSDYHKTSGSLKDHYYSDIYFDGKLLVFRILSDYLPIFNRYKSSAIDSGKMLKLNKGTNHFFDSESSINNNFSIAKNMNIKIIHQVNKVSWNADGICTIKHHDIAFKKRSFMRGHKIKITLPNSETISTAVSHNFYLELLKLHLLSVAEKRKIQFNFSGYLELSKSGLSLLNLPISDLFAIEKINDSSNI